MEFPSAPKAAEECWWHRVLNCRAPSGRAILMAVFRGLPRRARLRRSGSVTPGYRPAALRAADAGAGLRHETLLRPLALRAADAGAGGVCYAIAGKRTAQRLWRRRVVGGGRRSIQNSKGFKDRSQGLEQ